MSLGSIIGGGLSGGFGTVEQPALDLVNQGQSTGQDPQAQVQNLGVNSDEPIDMIKGHYLYFRDDLTIGTGPFPQSLTLHPRLQLRSRLQPRPLGRGWTHNLAISATRNADGFQALGEDSGLDAAAALVELMVSLDLLADPAKRLDRMVIATRGQAWFGDQMLNNSVIVTQGLNGEVFTRLPDGSLN